MKLKKILCGILAATVITVSAMPVFAGGISAEEQTILNNLSQTVTTPDGVSHVLPANYKAQATDYLTVNDLTPAQVNDVNAQISSSVELIKKEGITENVKKQVVAKAQTAASAIGITLNISADGKITPVAKDTPLTNKPVVKATGAAVDGTNAVVAMTALAGILAVAGYSISKNKLMDR